MSKSAPEVQAMNVMIEPVEDELQDDHVPPREQYVAQVADNSIPAEQVLEDQRQRPVRETATLLFGP